ncbi:hypothetical protein JAAARDRAFT_30334 [Jaapia argillacea MUCL 33604]|uniref:RNA helicase n=1 Tax=Jaapia argillacea MUCL 33604 TaxID=933084 RepID=A0A067QIM3_9AGAM|nr:hypothetical protein JAAARDRAFT_30334 [Jaapia argillacea MUCL 33604]
MNQPRERYNARARQSTAGSHKKGKPKRKSNGLAGEPAPNPNADVVEHKSKEQREDDRKEKLRLELVAESESKMNSKKKKRLDKYIDKKLMKEERVEILKKLAKTQAELPTLNLQSSSTLGTGKTSTHHERVEKQEDKEVRRLLDGTGKGKGKGKRKRARNDDYRVDVGDESDADADLDLESGMEVDEPSPSAAFKSPRQAKSTPIVVVDGGFSTSVEASKGSATLVGSALKRNADGSVVQPVVRKKKKKQQAVQSWKRVPHSAAKVDDSDTSFDSSDSEMDSDVNSDDGGADAEVTSSGEQDQDHEESTNGSDQGENSASSESGSDSEVEGGSPPPSTAKRKRKGLGFKEWAMKQLSVAKDYVAPLPSTSSSPPASTPLPAESAEPSPPSPKKRKISHGPSDGLLRGPLGEDLKLPNTSLAHHLHLQRSQTESRTQTSSSIPPSEPNLKNKTVPVTRPPEVQTSRLLLPIIAEEQEIMEAVLLNPVVVICGETGSGKTTQVPQFLYEAGFGCPESDNPGMIGITQPRRVAAVSMASRVSFELSSSPSPSSSSPHSTHPHVAYQIRYDASTVSPSTRIKFMTDGVLLRELANDFLLQRYSVVIVDEAHERSLNTDVLIGVLSRVGKLREEMWREGKDGIKPLRLIIMSATLRVSDFAENKALFSTPSPIINVPARQHPVTVHFNRRTPADYVTETIRKASKIHARLPPGGVLIFLTGQNEINGVCKKLEAKFGRRAIEERKKRRSFVSMRGRDEADEENRVLLRPSQADVEPEDIELGATEQELAADVDGDLVDVDEEALDSDDERNDDELGIITDESEVPMHVVPLYSLLPSDKQMKVFEPPPPDSRLVVVATNVAETSLTIPGIRYVIDCGRAKERRFDSGNGIQSFQVDWISKASAAQRAGRAGRTGPGHCYRLYSSALFENYFQQFAQPEILRMPIEGVVLQMKSMHIDAVVNFPFPTSPDKRALYKAETLLTHLGALDISSHLPKSSKEVLVSTLGGHITELGQSMALFPLSPRFSRMLVSGRQHGCLPYVIAIVSALSVGDPFLREEALGPEGDGDESDGEGLSEILSEVVKEKERRKSRRRAFFQAQQLHSSLGDGSSDIFRILSVVGAYEYDGGGMKFCADHFVRPKAMEEIHKLRAQISSIVQSNFSVTDTVFLPQLRPPTALQIKVLRQLLCAAFIDQVAVRKDRIERHSNTGSQYSSSKGVPYRALGISEDVFFHPSSGLITKPPPEYVVFHEILRTTRVFIKGITVVNPAWLSSLGKPSLCTFSKQSKNSTGEMMAIPRFGPEGWELPAVKVES